MDKKMPFSTGLTEYISKNPNFKISLKLYNPSRFEVFQRIFLSYPPDFPNDEVIGLIYCDKEIVKKNKKPFFKQDYIVNHRNGTFTSYTSISSQTKDVKHINDFFNKYGRGKYYGTDKGKGDHYYDNISDLHPIFQTEAQEILDKIKNEKQLVSNKLGEVYAK